MTIGDLYCLLDDITALLSSLPPVKRRSDGTEFAEFRTAMSDPFIYERIYLYMLRNDASKLVI